MRHILLLCMALLVAVASHAQVGELRRDVAIGVSAGATMNSISFVPVVHQAMKLSPMAGIVVRYTCEKYFTAYCGLQAEVNWCNMGWKEDFDPQYEPGKFYKRDMHYITVPIMARMGWGRDKRGFMGYIVAGPQIGYYMGGKESMSAGLDAANKGLTVERMNQYGKPIQNKFDYGITAGVGMELSTRAAGHFLLEARYYMGLADIFKNGKADHFGRSANGAITIKFAYLFDVLKTK